MYVCMYVCMYRFDQPLEGSSVNYQNDYSKVLKLINKLKVTFTLVDNENEGLVQNGNRNINVLYVLICSLITDFAENMLLSVIKKKINIVNSFTSNCICLKTCCKCGLHCVGETI